MAEQQVVGWALLAGYGVTCMLVAAVALWSIVKQLKTVQKELAVISELLRGGWR